MLLIYLYKTSSASWIGALCHRLHWFHLHSECRLFPDVDRDLDIEFDGTGGADSLHTFQVNASSSSLGVWVRYADKDGTGIFLSMHMAK